MYVYRLSSLLFNNAETVHLLCRYLSDVSNGRRNEHPSFQRLHPYAVLPLMIVPSWQTGHRRPTHSSVLAVLLGVGGVAWGGVATVAWVLAAAVFFLGVFALG